MYNKLFFPLLLASSLCLNLAWGGELTLSPKDVRATMEKIFHYHVESKSLSPQVVRRSFKLYLEQFDPEHFYLLKGEAENFLSPNDQTVNEVIQAYQGHDLHHFLSLNQIIQVSIQRARALRARIRMKLADNPELVLKKVPSSGLQGYAHSSTELEARLESQMVREIHQALKKKGIKEVSPALLERIVAHREKQYIHFEQEYMEMETKQKNHQLTFHVLKALAKSLDAHTGYYSPKEAYEMRSSLKKQFAGVGVVLQEDFDGVFIQQLIEGGPAKKSGKIHIGDQLVTIDGKDVSKISFAESLDLMKGRPGEKVKLGINRALDRGAPESVQLIREKIVMNDDRIQVDHETIEEGIIGKVTVPSFYDNGEHVSVEKDLKEAIRTLKAEGNLCGLVLDFRENGGGFLNQAIKVAGMFVNGGLIVVSKYANDEVSYARDVDGRQFFDGPVVILISKASASAAEVVAQALQDYGVAIVVGDETSYGKGTMQFQTLTDENAKIFFKVTVGRYYTASGRSPQIHGVKADIVVPTLFSPYNIGERYLEFPLAGDQLSGELCDSLMSMKAGSYRNRPTHVVPYLQPRETKWRQMISELKSKSFERIDKSENFQEFLKQTRAKKKGLSLSVQRSGDLQMEESVAIVKDMVKLDRPVEVR